MKLRQIALVARSLAEVVDDITVVLGIEVSFRDPSVGRYGLENVVMPVGDTFLEVVAPKEANTTAGRYLDRRGGNGGYMVILQSDDLDGDRRRVAQLGVRVVEQIDRPTARGTHLHPKDVGGAILSLDDMKPPTAWEWAGPDWRAAVHTEVTRSITGVEVQVTNPKAVAEQWGKVLARPLSSGPAGPLIRLDTGVIRFVPVNDSRGDGVSAVDLLVADRERLLATARARGVPASGDTVTLCGTRFRLTS